ncbi:MAG: hypothetical protein QOJ80_451 [Mycobacterium sp.]|jgi:hypothetical protein|nr:hypothetical protein [Mycobacterium sp.]
MIDFTDQVAIVPITIVDEALDVCDSLGVRAMPDNAEVALAEPAK